MAKKGEVSVIDFDFDNLTAIVYSDSCNEWEIDGLKAGESHIERFEGTHTSSIEIYRRTR